MKHNLFLRDAEGPKCIRPLGWVMVFCFCCMIVVGTIKFTTFIEEHNHKYVAPPSPSPSYYTVEVIQLLDRNPESAKVRVKVLPCSN